jgi:hypothetical protein
MLRDNLAELHKANSVEIVKKVSGSLPPFLVLINRKLVASLDIASFRDVGNKINEIVRVRRSGLADLPSLTS